MSIGNRIFLKRDLPDMDLIEEYSKLPSANIEDCMNRIFGIGSDIKLMSNPEKIMAGVALTVKTRAGDNLMIHKALEMAGENDIIIVSNEGDRSRALIGEIMATYALHARKVAGLVFDGPIRDIDMISECKLPIFATGHIPSGPFKEGPGEINVPIAIGGRPINPGDIIVGDRDGIVIIPKEDAEAVLKPAKEKSAADASKVEASKNGTADKKWVDEKLLSKETEIIDDVYK